MWKWINENIKKFEVCFSRKTSYGWFVIIIIGLMLRTDHLGLTGIVRELSLTPNSYNSINHFFRAESWNINGIRFIWIKIIKSLSCLITESGRYILIGDGVKESKEGRKMPGVKKLHQESENSAKGEYIYGHLFGALGILAGNTAKQYSLLISVSLHEGISFLNKWFFGNEYNEESHVVKMIREAVKTAEHLGNSILLLDRLYLTRPMLETLNKQELVCAVTKAKSNAIGYYDPKPKTGRGAKPKKGEAVKITEFFTLKTAEFVTKTMTLYRKEKEVKYYCADLLWGQGLYQKLRFVLTEMDGMKSILVSTDLTLEPEQIIRLYCYRFKIECSFRELKQTVAGFSYRFWSKAMPKSTNIKTTPTTLPHLKISRITSVKI
jgi:hypothetical protein